MVISDRARKLLWGKSGNRCAICQASLVRNKTKKDSDSIIGDECHIVSKKPHGPRYDPDFNGNHDAFENLILMCKSDHKMVDDQPQKYNVKVLNSIKTSHEKWVDNTLDYSVRQQPKENNMIHLPRLTTGKELFGILWNAHFYQFDYDELNTNKEREAIGQFLQFLQDYGDFSTEIEAGQRVDVEYHLSTEIQQLDLMGFWVFGKNAKHKVQFDDKYEFWPMAIVTIHRKENPTIIGIKK